MRETRSAAGTQPPASLRDALAPRILMAVLGLTLTLIGGGKYYLNARYQSEGREVIGTVTGTDGSRRSRLILYEFRTPDGGTFHGRQSRYGYSIGQPVRLEYLASDPEWNRVAGSDRDDYRTYLPTGLAGALFLLVGLYSVSYVLRTRRAP